MGIYKKEYNEHMMVDEIAEKVANEPLEEDIDKLDEDMDEIPQHVIDENKVDEAIMRMHDRAQWEMYNDPTMNLSLIHI